MRSAVGLSALLFSFAQTASAAEQEILLSVEPAYAVTTGGMSQHGLGGQVTFAYGLTDALWMTVSAGGSRQLARGELEGRTLLEAFGGLTAALDVLRVIPFAELLIGVVRGQAGNQAHYDPTLRLGAGFDYLLSPSFSVGAVFRYRPVSDAIGDDDFTVSARLCWRVEL